MTTATHESPEFSSDLTVNLIDSMGSDASVLAAMMVSTQGVRSLEMLERDPFEDQGKIEFLMKNRHGSPFEHGALTVFVEAPIAVFREWHRHRIGFSYNEVSGRYTKLAPKFYVPPPERPLVQVGKPGHYTFVPGTEQQYAFAVEEIQDSCAASWESYEALLESGVAKEVARGVLPVYIYTSMYVTLNPRSAMAFLSLRTKFEESTFPSFPMWEIEQCGHKLDAHLGDLFPLTRTAFRKFGSVAP